jgi:hypothetical protein
VRRECALRSDCGRGSAVGVGEDDEELVTTAVDLVAATFGNDSAEQAPMPVEQSLIAVAEPMDKPRRSSTSVNSSVTVPPGSPDT